MVKIKNRVKQLQHTPSVNVYIFFELYLMVGPTLLLICALNSGQNILVWVGIGYSPNRNCMSYEGYMVYIRNNVKLGQCTTRVKV